MEHYLARDVEPVGAPAAPVGGAHVSGLDALEGEQAVRGTPREGGSSSSTAGGCRVAGRAAISPAQPSPTLNTRSTCALYLPREAQPAPACRREGPQPQRMDAFLYVAVMVVIAAPLIV